MSSRYDLVSYRLFYSFVPLTPIHVETNRVATNFTGGLRFDICDGESIGGFDVSIRARKTNS
jgi:hypothetical protein